MRIQEKNKHGKSIWSCKCDCGNLTEVARDSLVNGDTRSCGCLRKERAEIRRNELLGKTFGRLTIVSIHSINGGYTNYNCTCSCGNQTITDGNSILVGRSKSCGCYNREVATTHGLSRHPLYNTWKSMIDRCYVSAATGYSYYGGRGISVCDEWRYSPEAFIGWAETNGYGSGLTIDRYPDNDGNYEPNNCRWVSMMDQARNRRNNVIRDMDMARAIRKDTRRPTDIAEDYGVSLDVVCDIKAGKTWKE